MRDAFAGRTKTISCFAGCFWITGSISSQQKKAFGICPRRHTEDDIAATLKVIDKVLSIMKGMGL